MPQPPNNKKKKARKPKGKKPSKTTATVKILPNAIKMPTRTMPTINRSSKMSIHESVCQITDPFCAKAKGSKWPDGLGGCTMAMQLRAHVPYSSLSNGGRLVYASASLPYGILDSDVYGSGYYTQNATYSSSTLGNSFTTYAATYRIVSWGIIVRNMLPALTSSGYVMISRITTMPAISSTESPGVVFGSEVSTHPLYAGSELVIIGRPIGTEARKFVPLSTTTTINTGWDVIKIEVVGAPASTTGVIDLEFIYNVEFTLPDAQLTLHQFVKVERPNAPKAIEASNLILNRIADVSNKGIESFGKSVLNAAETAVEDLLSSAVGFLGL